MSLTTSGNLGVVGGKKLKLNNDFFFNMPKLTMDPLDLCYFCKCNT